MVRTSKVFVTIVTAAALVLGMLALAIPALADTNNPAPWHSHYFTENVEFKTGVPGDSFQFVAQYTNGGQRSWVKGAVGQEARLGAGWTFGDPANPADNTNDFNGGWSVNWLSSNRLAAQTESTVLPGTNATFTYTGKIPAGAPAGRHAIKAQPVVEGVQWLENYGYYQGFDVQVTGVAAAPTISSVTTPNGTARVQVCFNKPMATSDGFSIDDLDHFTISGFTITASTPNADGTCTTLTLTAGLTKDQTFTLTVTDVADKGGNALSPNPTNISFTATDSVNPTVLSISQPGTYTIVVKFSEAINPSTATAGAFRFDSGNWSTVSSTTGISFRTGASRNEQVRLDFKCGVDTGTGQAQQNTCSPPVSNGNHALDIKDVQDAAGNVITPNPTSFTVTIVGTNDTVRPTATATVLQASDLNPACNTDGSGCVYSQYVNVDYSESMQTEGATLDVSTSADFATCGTAPCATPFTVSAGSDPFAIDRLTNYTFQNPDGSAATTTCTTGGTLITPVPASGSMSRSNQNRFEQRRIRLRLSALFQTGCNYSMVIGPTVTNPVRDEQGNSLNPSPTVLAINATQDTTAPTVARVFSNGAKLIIVYSKSMAGSASATTKANYTSTNSSLNGSIIGAPATVAFPSPASSTTTGTYTNPYDNNNGDETALVLTFCPPAPTTCAPLAAGTYPLTITGVTDPNGNVISPNPTQITFTVVDTTAPTLDAAAFVSNTSSGSSFTVTYSKPMTAGQTGANSAGNPQNYAVNNGGFGALCSSGTLTITSSNADKTFTIACTGSGAWSTSATTSVVTARNVADQAGNVINPNPAARGF